MKPQVRRLSSRRYQQKDSSCAYCDEADADSGDLKRLFAHLAAVHCDRYFACAPCEERFPTEMALREHNAEAHREAPSARQKEVKRKAVARELRSSRKPAVKSTKVGVKRSARLQSKTGEGQKVVSTGLWCM